MYEIELKYRLTDIPRTLQSLVELGAVEGKTEMHEDTYYRHPCRDFASTGEALRIRRCDGIAHVTYKGAKQIVSSGKVDGIKLRRELEWCLAPSDSDGSNMDSVFRSLGFSIVACVRKQRRPFSVQMRGTAAVVTIDSVANLGTFAEIEVLCGDSPEPHLNQPEPHPNQPVLGSNRQMAIEAIAALAEQLGVGEAEPRSYLRMVLEQDVSDG